MSTAHPRVMRFTSNHLASDRRRATKSARAKTAAAGKGAAPKQASTKSRKPRAGQQLELPLVFKNHGGKRKGAGRKPAFAANGNRVHGSHARRGRVTKAAPLHVSIKVVAGLPSLRDARLWGAVHGAIRGSRRGEEFRITAISVMSNHVHVVIEAANNGAFTAGLKSLNGRLARAVNRALGRRGRVVEPRSHVHALGTPTEYRNAVSYVLRNGERHGAWRPWGGTGAPRPDPRSSAAWFPHWREKELALQAGQMAADAVDDTRSWMARRAFEGVELSFRDAVAGARQGAVRRGGGGAVMRGAR